MPTEIYQDRTVCKVLIKVFFAKMELYLRTVTSKDAVSAQEETSEAHLVTTLSNSYVVLYALQPFLFPYEQERL